MPLLLQDVVEGIAEARNSAAQEIIQAVQDNMMVLLQGDPRLADTCGKISKVWRDSAIHGGS